jgi:uncharacterized protein DUF1877
MGIQVTYRRLAAEELDALEADTERAMSYFFSIPGMDLAEMAALLNDPEAMQARGGEILAAFESAQEDPTRVDLDKDWHALHFLLTSDASLDEEHRPNDPLHNVVMGGHPTTIDAGYGPVRKFSRQDIRQIVEALSPISAEEFRARFSADAFNAAGIYPNPRPGGWTIDEAGMVFELFPKLRQLFEDALSRDEIVIVYAT